MRDPPFSFTLVLIDSDIVLSDYRCAEIKLKLSSFRLKSALSGPADLTDYGLDKGITPLLTRVHILDREKKLRWKLPIRGMKSYPYNRMAIDTAHTE